MKNWTIVVVAAALFIPLLDYGLYSPPNRLEMIDASGVPSGNEGPNVRVLVRNCKPYARYTGRWWWKRTEVDYRACGKDPATEAESKVIGEFKQPPSTSSLRIQFIWACVSCREARLFHSVKIPLGASSENGPLALTLPLNVRLTPEDEMQLTFFHGTDPQTPLTIGVPDVE